MSAGGVNVVHSFQHGGRRFRVLELPHFANDPPNFVLEIFVGGDLNTVRATDTLWTRAVGMDALLAEIGRLASATTAAPAKGEAAA
jgi:hypothetical protein